ncbi:MAG: class B sortase [Lachnospiraceae bacterium]|nr:class B sortase [Clostridium sp.]MDY4821584.1 class B sortase [Lachnospiraceae bacterium]
MYEAAGRQFRTEADYKLALHDKAEIEKIKKQRNTDTPEQIDALLADIAQGKIRLYTILKEDFTEELQDKKETLLKAGDGFGKEDKRKKPAGRQRASSGKSKSHTSLDEFDADMQKRILREMKKREHIRRGIVAVCSLLVVGSLAYLANYSYRTKRLDDYAAIQKNLKNTALTTPETPETPVIHYDDDTADTLPDILPEYQTLYSLNKRLIGWVKIDDTYIDYPVLQTVNNDYYLNHNFDQEEDKNGSIFLDKDCSIYPRSTNLILYGHHMRSGRMFGQLNKYSSEKFYKEHKYIQFDTIYEKGTYEVMYVFRSKIYEESEIVFKYYQFTDAVSETEFESNMMQMADMSLYDTGVSAEYGDELLTLSTCDYYTSDGRFVVVAKKIR